MRHKLPKHIAIVIAFKSVYQLLAAIKAGEVDFVEEKVSMKDIHPKFKNTYFSASMYLKLWCEAWAFVAREAKIIIKTESILELANILDLEEIIVEESLIKKIEDELKELRKLFLTLPNGQFMRAIDKFSEANNG